jgi:hypothetical protein
VKYVWFGVFALPVVAVNALLGLTDTRLPGGTWGTVALNVVLIALMLRLAESASRRTNRRPRA